MFFLAEFQETRKEHDFFTICRTPELACEVTLQVLYYHEAACSLNYVWCLGPHYCVACFILHVPFTANQEV